MTARIRRLAVLVCLTAGLSVAGAAIAIYVTWPANAVANYFHDRRNRQLNISALEWRVGVETDPFERGFYQAWLAEEKGDLEGAIRGFQALRASAGPGTQRYLRSSLRLGLAYGLNGQPDRELRIYLGLKAQYPGPSRLSQAAYYLRQGDRLQARRVLDEALVQDEKDGSLGSGRGHAQSLRGGLGPASGKRDSDSK